MKHFLNIIRISQEKTNEAHLSMGTVGLWVLILIVLTKHRTFKPNGVRTKILS